MNLLRKLVTQDGTSAESENMQSIFLSDSAEAVTNSTGGVKGRHDYLPFGEDVGATVSNRSTVNGYSLQDGLRQKFTQKERDSESGLDYFIARYYSAAQGRFTSADTLLADQYEDDPQSWNLFTYVRNNPLKYVDPFGLWIEVAPGVWQWEEGDTWKTLSEKTGISKKALKKAFKGVELGPGLAPLDVNGLSAGAPVQSYASTDITPLFAGVAREMNRREAASLKLIGIIAEANFLPIQLITGSGLLRGGITQLALTGTRYATKHAARQALARMALSEAQRTAANKAISKATANSTIEIIKEGSNVIINVSRPGSNGHQVIEFVIGAAGNKTVVQKAFDAAGKLVHYDPKTP